MAKLYEHSAFLDRAFKHFLAMRPVLVRPPPANLQWGEIKILAFTLFQWGFVRNTRAKFWGMLFKAFMQLDKRRLFLFIRSCIALEHYVDLEQEFITMLGPV